MFKLHRPSPALVVATGALAVAAGGVAFATIPGTDGTIDGCYRTAGGGAQQGALRVIDADGGQHCLAGEKAIAWNATGPKGDPGPSDVYTAAHPAAAPTWTISVDVPAGSYLAVGKATAIAPSGSLGQTGGCVLAADGGTPADTTDTVAAGPDAGAAVPVQAPFTLSAPGTIAMTCTGQTTTVGATRMAQGALAVTKVGAVH